MRDLLSEPCFCHNIENRGVKLIELVWHVGIDMDPRFIIDKHDEDSGEPQGLFQAVSDLLHGGHLPEEERITARNIFTWFAKNLPVPERFSRSAKRSAKAVAISWFKPTAHECIKRMQDLAGILYVHDIPTKVIKSRRPGYVVYEDDYQIVAQPFSGRK
jgi:hypothetical protein